jgi:hypothetical protein
MVAFIATEMLQKHDSWWPQGLQTKPVFAGSGGLRAFLDTSRSRRFSNKDLEATYGGTKG